MEDDDWLALTWLDYALLLGALVATWLYFFQHRVPSSSGSKMSASTVPVTGGGGTILAGSGESDSLLAKRMMDKQVLVFYGSQTGTAEEYAGRLVKEARQYGLRGMAADLMDYDPEDLCCFPRDKLLMFALATYGEGEPTDNARDFYEWLMSEDRCEVEGELPLQGIHYVLFGLGNKTYEHFNIMARNCDRRLQELGAKRIGPRGEGDDDGNLEEDFLKWKDGGGVWTKVCDFFHLDPNRIQHELIRSYALKELVREQTVRVFRGEIGTVNAWNGKQRLGCSSRVKFTATFPMLYSRVAYDAKNPYYASIHSWKELFAPGARQDMDPTMTPTSTTASTNNLARSCLHVELDIRGTNLRYATGDHVAIYPMNDPREVEALAKALGIADCLDQVLEMKALEAYASKKYPFPCPTTYRAALTHYLDIQALPKTHILSALGQYAKDPKERAQLERMGLAANKEEYLQYIVHDGRNLRQVLEEHPSVQVVRDAHQVINADGHAMYLTIGDIFELLPRLQPRYYSISSSPKLHPHQIHITAAIARYRTPLGRDGLGVATGYLERLCKRPETLPQHLQRVPIFLRTSTFKLPKNITKPVLMIGPGTGVAPFRAFAQERKWVVQDRLRVLREAGRLPKDGTDGEIDANGSALLVQEISLPGGLHLKRTDASAQNGVGTIVGETILFFGCRDRHQDFLYRQEWTESYFPNKPLDPPGCGLTELVCAFSREQPGAKTYVQHRLREHGTAVWKWLYTAEGYLYVCGDAKNMARDVQRTIVELAMREGAMSEEQAVAWVKLLREKGRYLEDVWS